MDNFFCHKVHHVMLDAEKLQVCEQEVEIRYSTTGENCLKLKMYICSQTKFVAIILVLSVFFVRDFLLDLFFVGRF